MNTPKSPCFYEPGSHSIIDLAVLVDNVWRSQINNEDIDQLRARYPNAEFGDFDVIYEQKINSYKSDPVEITEAEFIRALEILPPVGWTTAKGVESFKMSERLSGMITAIYARVGKRYFSFNDTITLKADEIADRIGSSDAFKRKPLKQISFAQFRELNPNFYRNQEDAEYDFELLARSIHRLNDRKGPRVGDFVIMPDKSVRRFTYDWSEANGTIQTTDPKINDASFYFSTQGFCDYSGALDDPIPVSQLEDTLENRLGRVWFFSRDYPKAHNGVYAQVAFRVYRYHPKSTD